MEIKFLGTGGAFDYTKGTSAATVRTSEGSFLIDCGPSIYEALCENNLVEQIDFLLLTHLHADHIGSLGTMLAHFERSTGSKVKILYPTETFKESLVQLLTVTFVAHHVELIKLDGHSDKIGYIDTTSQHVKNMPTFAYYFTEGDELIYYSGDLGVLDTTVKFLKSRSEKNIHVFQDINPKEGRAHVHYKEASERLAGYEAYGYHCDKVTMPADNTLPLVEDYPELNY